MYVYSFVKIKKLKMYMLWFKKKSELRRLLILLYIILYKLILTLDTAREYTYLVSTFTDFSVYSPKQISHFLPTWIALASFLPVLNVPHTPSTYERHCQAILWLDAKFHSHATAYPLKKEPPSFLWVTLSGGHLLLPFHPFAAPHPQPTSSIGDGKKLGSRQSGSNGFSHKWVPKATVPYTIYTKLYVRISIYSDITNSQGHPCERGEKLLQLSWLWGAALKHSNANAFE